MQEASRTGFRKISGPGFTTMLKLSTGHCDTLTGWQTVAVLPFLASLVISSERLFFFFCFSSFFKDRLLLYISGYLAPCQVARMALNSHQFSNLAPTKCCYYKCVQTHLALLSDSHLMLLLWSSDKFKCIRSLCQILILVNPAGKENGGWYYLLRKPKLGLFEEEAFITIFAATMCPATHRRRDGFLVTHRFHLIRNGPLI